MKTRIFKNHIKSIILFYLICSLSYVKAQTLINDNCNNQYNTKILKDQVWMIENLKVGKFRNGDSIKEAKNETEWINAGKKSQPVWCYYKFNPENEKMYGRLYNWHALNDSRGLAPLDWKIPSIEDWKKLTNNYSYVNLKTEDLLYQGTQGKNASGFNMIAGGGIDQSGNSTYKNKVGIYWSSTTKDIDNSWFMYADEYNIAYYSGPKESGFSIRCIREKGLLGWTGNLESEQKAINTRLGIDSIVDIRNNKVYPAMDFGGKIWMTKNLNVKKFRNGDLIPESKTKEEWIKAAENGQPTWCYYNNDKLNGDKYGLLYNWYAVNDERGLSPLGSHIPSRQDIEDLELAISKKDSVNNVGYNKTLRQAVYSIKMRSAWNYISGTEYCNSGFELMAGGCRSIDGGFNRIGEESFLWTSEDELKRTAWYQNVKSISNYTYSENKGMGMYVRCLKD